MAIINCNKKVRIVNNETIATYKSYIYTGNNVVPISAIKHYTVPTDLCFTARQANSTVGYTVTGTVDTSGIQYSRDRTTWTAWDGSKITLTNIGDKLYVKNSNNTLSIDSNNYFRFTSTGALDLSGDCKSMLNYSNISTYCFYRMFHSNYSIVDASKLVLSADILFNSCYSNMFYSCGNLIEAPELPATVMADNCYSSMFAYTKLTVAPELPALTLAEYCYRGMFQYCTNLTTPPQLPATELVSNCYRGMFQHCGSLKVSNSSGTLFFTAPSTLSDSSHAYNMFVNTGGTYTSNPVANGEYYYY